MNNINILPKLNIIFFTSIMIEFVFVIMISVNFGEIDKYFFQTFFSFSSTFIIISFLIFLTIDFIKRNNFHPFSIAFFFKLLIALNFIVIYLYLKGDLFLNNMGDDHTYVALGYEYKYKIQSFITNEWNSYAAPYGFFSVISSTFLFDPNVLRLIQFFLSVLTAVYFYKLLQLLNFDEQVCRIVFCLFVITPSFTFFSIFVFKDTFILFSCVFILYQIFKKNKNLNDRISIFICYSLIFFLRPAFVPVILILHLSNLRLSPYKFLRYQAFTKAFFLFLLLAMLTYVWINFFNSFEIFTFLDYRLASTSSTLSGNINVDFARSFLAALSSMLVMPPVFSDFNTPWSTQESAFVFGRMFNYFLFIIFCYGITDFKKINFVTISFLACIIAICIGMSLLGQFLSDRHKLILLPFGFYFIAKGVQRIGHLKPSSITISFLFFSVISLIVQFVFIELRISSHGF